MKDLCEEHNSATLIICRYIQDLHFIRKIRNAIKGRVVIASDDPRVHDAAVRLGWINTVTWTEGKETLYSVSSDVINYLNKVNQFLKDAANGQDIIPKELFFWICHAEGGMTTQRIQDSLLLIRSYLGVFDDYRINGVFLICNQASIWEDNVLKQVARSRNIEVKIIGELSLKVLFSKASSLFKYFLRDFLNILCVIRVKLKRFIKYYPVKKFKDEIDFQLCSGSNEHIENIVPIMKALKKRNYRPIALCWNAPDGANKVRKEGLDVEELENYISGSIIWSSFFNLHIERNKFKIKLKELILDRQFYYMGVHLAKMLLPSMHYFMQVDLPQRYRLDAALKKYFTLHSPVAIKLWGGGKIIEGDLVLKNIDAKKKPLLMYWFWIALNNPYDSFSQQINLFLSSGIGQEKYLNKYGVSSNRIRNIGMNRYDHLSDFIEKHSPSQSREYLGLPQGFSFYILYDSNYIVRGYLTAAEQIQVLNSLLSFSKQSPEIALMIKPHPAHHGGILEQYLKYYPLKNAFLINKDMLPYHAINASNLVITKCSTLGLEAMIFKRPIVSVILDGETHWKVYGKAVEYLTDTSELCKLLGALSRDIAFRNRWSTNALDRQDVFLRENFHKDNRLVSDIAADEIEHSLKGREPYSNLKYPIC